MMKRRDFLKWTALIAAGTSAAPRPAPGAEPRKSKPNIIYIMADDLGYGDLSCYGQEKFKTPHIDRMAREGLRFTQYYSGSTVCAPARCSLMTGLHTGHAVVRGNHEIEPEGQMPLPAGTLTVAKIMKKAGYATGAFGKWGLGPPNSSGSPSKQGFDLFYGYLCQRHAHRYYPPYLRRNDERVEIQANLDGKQGAYTHDLIVEEAFKFLRRNKDRPFFLYLPFTIPHADVAVPEDSLEPYKGKFPEAPYANGYYHDQPTPRAAFAGMVSRLDRDVGRLMALVKELGLDRSTLVMFTSDNGPHREGGHDPDFFNSNGPLRGIKRDLYEGGIRVPLIARWPGRIQPGGLTDHQAAFWDLLPTCAELAGVAAPKSIDGISMAPILSGRPGDQKKHDYLYWEFKAIQAVRMGDWKAVHFLKTGKLELYNLEADPGEKRDVSAQNPKIVAQVKTILKTAHTDSPDFPLLKK